MLKGLQQIDGKSYYFGSDGVRQIGWVSDGSSRKYLKDDGTLLKGWHEIDNKKYYFDNNGVDSTQQKDDISGKWYEQEIRELSKKGIMVGDGKGSFGQTVS